MKTTNSNGKHRIETVQAALSAIILVLALASSGCGKPEKPADEEAAPKVGAEVSAPIAGLVVDDSRKTETESNASVADAAGTVRSGSDGAPALLGDDAAVAGQAENDSPASPEEEQPAPGAAEAAIQAPPEPDPEELVQAAVRRLAEKRERKKREVAERKAASDRAASELREAAARDILASMVRIPGQSFSIGKTEVTQDQWEGITGSNPSVFKEGSHPVESVSWVDIESFIQKLNSVPLVKESGVVFRLPTEDEWRLASCAGDYEDKISNGYSSDSKIDIHEIAWLSRNSGGTTKPVAQLQPNRFGLYDMIGNVGEWTADHWRNQLDYFITIGLNYDNDSPGYGLTSEPGKLKLGSGSTGRSARLPILGFRLCAEGGNPSKADPDSATKETPAGRESSADETAQLHGAKPEPASDGTARLHGAKPEPAADETAQLHGAKPEPTADETAQLRKGKPEPVADGAEKPARKAKAKKGENAPPEPKADWYVDAGKGDDANGGASWGAAFASIQKAIDAASEGQTILVADGVYGPVVSRGKAVTIRSKNGPAACFVDGGGKESCADLANATAVGITFRNGARGRRAPGDGCAGVQNGSYEGCVITGNVGAGAGSAAGARAATLRNCLVYGNEFSGWGGAAVAWCTIANCTVANNKGNGIWDCASVDNCIVWGNSSDVYISSGQVQSAPRHSCYSSARYNGEGSIHADPSFADPAKGDFRLAAGSPCIDAGDSSRATETTDLEGNPRIVGVAVDIGCYERLP